MTAARGLDHTLAALADPVRRRTVELLSHGPHSAGSLARTLEVPAPAMSRHLRALRAAGLVEEGREAPDHRVRVYQLRPGPIRELNQWLARAETQWSAQLDAFRRHVEGEG